MYTPFDFNEATRHRVEFVEDKLREGSPVVGLSCEEGLLVLSVCRSQRKIYEVYDRLIYSAIGRQADIEQLRIAAIDVAHREGYERSPDDVTVQRLVGFALSPPLKRLFGDQMASPSVVRSIFGELGHTPEKDLLYILNYDGEFTQHHGFASVGGTLAAEDQMNEILSTAKLPVSLETGVPIAIRAWAAGAMTARRKDSDEDVGPVEDIDAFLLEELKTARIEAGLLERNTKRENRFRLLTDLEFKPLKP